MSLIKKIDDKTAKIGVIGLGYVGLPLAAEFVNAGFEKGILTVPGGENTIRLLPPLNISNEEINFAIDMLDKCASDFKVKEG